MRNKVITTFCSLVILSAVLVVFHDAYPPNFRDPAAAYTASLPPLQLYAVNYSYSENNYDSSNNKSRIMSTTVKLSQDGTLRVDLLLSSGPISKHVVIHRVYFDNRKGIHKFGADNQTVFFIDAQWEIFENEWITGCGIATGTNQSSYASRSSDYVRGLIISRNYKISLAAQWWAYKRLSNKKYEHMQVYCFNLPGVRDGDRAFLVYKTSEQAKEYLVESQHPLIVPARQNILRRRDGYKFTVLTCLKVNSKGAPYLKEVIEYQRTIGMDHISLLMLSTFIRDRGLINLLKANPELRKYFFLGYITVDLWKEWYDEKKDIREFSECIRKVACMYHYRGVYDYATPIDSDDFFTPRVYNKTNIKYYIERFCSEHGVGSCMMKWIYYYPQHCGLKSIPKNGNVTAALKSYVHDVAGIRAPKSIHKIQALIDATYHDARPHGGRSLVKGYIVKNIDLKYAYIAHNRNGAKLWKICTELFL